MSNNFTDNAKEVITNATNEVMRLRSSLIDTGHIVLGMLRVKSCSATQVISSFVSDLDELKEKIEDIIKHSPVSNANVGNNNPNLLSVNAGKVLQRALLESMKKQSSKINTTNILAAIMSLEDNDKVKELLSSYGITHDEVVNFDFSAGKEFSPGIEIYMKADSPQELLEKIGASGLFSKPSKKKSENKNHRSEEASTRYLQQFGKDLSLAAEQGELDPVVGREDVIERVAQILSRRKKNNPILVGEAGVGKSAIAEGIALYIAQKKVPYTLLDKRIFTLDLASVVAGTKYRGQFEERLKGLISELQKNPNLILFIDEIHTMIGAGNAEGGLDASNIFKPALARGEIQCIGATTNAEYRKYFESDSALERRFQKVLIEPTTIEQTIEILKNIKPYYERFHKVTYTDKAIEACVRLSDRYISGRYLPDKAIDTMDEAGARSHVKNVNLPKDLKDIDHKIEEAKQEKQQFIEKQQFEQAGTISNKITALEDTYLTHKKDWEQSLEQHPVEVNEDDIAQVISSMTGITVERVDEDQTKKLLDMDKVIKSEVIGQDEAIDKICKSVRRARIGLKDPNRPIGSFIFVGPTGVGKTYLAQMLAQYMFGSKDNIIRIDMSEYMEKFNVSRLIGSAPGYIGYEESGQLTEQVRLHPYSIVLFDEIEKAHKDVFNLLLQILDEGRLTDSMGRTVDFKNTIIIMTSNVGSRTLKDFGTGVGFSTNNRQQSIQKMEQNIIDKDIQKTFAPEFLNRIDDIVFFNSLTEDNLLKIVDLELKSLCKRIEQLGYKINITQGAKQYILNSDTKREFGARPIKRAIQKYIENPLSELILQEIQNKSDRRNIIIKQTSGKNRELKFEFN